MDHSSNTAFFEVTAETNHGDELVCSHSTCQQGGIKFVWCNVSCFLGCKHGCNTTMLDYCIFCTHKCLHGFSHRFQYCDGPVAKRSFRVHHEHQDLKDAQAKGQLVAKKHAVNVDGTDEQRSSSKRQKTSPALEAPLAALAAAAAGVQANAPRAAQAGGHPSIQITSGYSDTSSFSASTENNRPADGTDSNYSSGDDNNVENVVGVPSNELGNVEGRLKNEWLALLEERRRVETAHDMSAWLLRVFSVAEQCSADRNNNISDDDDVNNNGVAAK